jgi:phosphotransferase system enzyme I (PtsI)
MHPTRISATKQRVLRADTRRLAALLPVVLEADDCAAASAALLGGANNVHH